MFPVPRTILLVDDDIELVTLLVDYLELEGFTAVAAHNGPEALELLTKRDFDLMVLDVMMPGMNGIEVLRRVRETSQIPVLMLTARGDPVDRIVGLELGADDYVAKPCPPRELAARINAILRRVGSSAAATSALRIGPVTIDPPQRKATVGDRQIELTSTEFSLLEVLARKVGQPVPKEEIYLRVLGREKQRFDRAIDVHVSALRHKLNDAAGDAVAIESIRGIGYQLIIRSAE